jgi:predicted Holliday junction resolvase-like endonuclease
MDTSLLLLAVLVVVFVYQVVSLKRSESNLKKEVTRLQGESYQSESDYKLKITEFETQIHNKVQEQFQIWQRNECEAIRVQQMEIARREANAQLAQWKYESEILIRHDAIQRSQSVIIGKVSEHLLPYMPNFAFNPKDVRFIGSPIDLIIFNGMDEEQVREIVFVEVKTGASAALTKRERQIRDAINAGRVKWIEMRINREGC